MPGTSVPDSNAQAITDAYNQVIGRDPTAAELAASVQQVQGGVPVASIRAYLATTGYAALAVQTIYAKALGRAITAPELASDLRDLAAGGRLGGLLGYLSTTVEAAAALGAVYAAVLGRPPTAAELTASQGQLQASYSLPGVRYLLATSPAGIAAVQGVFQDVAGRAPTAGELIGAEAAIGTGAATLPNLRAYFATTTEAAGKLQALYLNELGRAVTPGELVGNEAAIASGSSLAAIRQTLSTSAEAIRALQAVFRSNPPNGYSGFGIGAADLATAELALANGTSLQAAELTNPSLITNDYQYLLGTNPDAGTLAAIQQAIASTPKPTFLTVQQAVIAAVAASPEFASTLTATFQAALGRPATPAEIASYGAMLRFDTPSSEPDVPSRGPPPVTLSDLKAQVNTLGLQALYTAELGRAITTPEIYSDFGAFARGGTFAQLRGYLSTSTEAATALLRQYQTTFGVPATVAALSKGEQALAAGASLQAAVSANPPTAASPVSTADAVALLTLFQTVFKGPQSLADLAASEQALAGGASLAAATVSNPYGQSLIISAWTRLLGTAPSAADVAAVAQAFTQTVGATRIPTVDSDWLQEALNIAAGASATFANGINAALQTAIGHPANAVELAAYRSELDSGAQSSFGQYLNVQPAPTLPALQQQIAQLGTGPSGSYAQLAPIARINPQTVAGVPGFIYGLFENDALITPSATTQTGTGYVGNLNLQTDILQIERSQAASFGALNLVQTNPGQNGSQILFTTVKLSGGASIELINVQKSDLMPANFRFV